MKRIIYSLFIFVTFVMISCEGVTTEDNSVITHYALLELDGATNIKLSVGDTYIESGYTATEGDVDITSKVVVTGSVDTSTPGLYVLTYSVSNEDGYSTSATRQILVVDPDSFASAYWGEVTSGTRHYTDTPVIITNQSGDLYEIDDLIGGFQWNGVNAGLDPPYDLHLEAILQLNADNSITLVSKGSWYFENVAVLLESGDYNPETGTVTLNLTYGGNPMNVTLTK